MEFILLAFNGIGVLNNNNVIIRTTGKREMNCVTQGRKKVAKIRITKDRKKPSDFFLPAMKQIIMYIHSVRYELSFLAGSIEA